MVAAGGRGSPKEAGLVTESREKGLGKSPPVAFGDSPLQRGPKLGRMGNLRWLRITDAEIYHTTIAPAEI